MSSPLISTAARLRCMATRWPHRPAILDAGNGTLKRSKKKSFDWYKKVIATNGEDLS